MIKKNDLEDLITRANLVGFETEPAFDGDIQNIIYIKSNEISEILRFAETNKIKTIFYSYSYYDKKDYEIFDEMLSEYDSRISKTIEKKAFEYNKIISKLDFSRPIELYVYCSFQGCFFTTFNYDEWIEDMDLLTADEKLDKLLESCGEIAEELLAEVKTNREALKIRLKEFVLADPHFFQCTNQKLRKNYINNLLLENLKFKEAFLEFGYLKSECIEYIEFIWKDIKSN